MQYLHDKDAILNGENGINEFIRTLAEMNANISASDKTTLTNILTALITDIGNL